MVAGVEGGGEMGLGLGLASATLRIQ